MINYGATFAVAVLLSLYLQYIREFSAETAGFILVAQPVIQTLFSPLAGKLSDRIEPRIVATTGMAITTAGLSFFIFLTPVTPLYAIVIALMVLGFGYALFSSPNTNAIMSSATNRPVLPALPFKVFCALVFIWVKVLSSRPATSVRIFHRQTDPGE
jgi:MFS family permease